MGIGKTEQGYHGVLGRAWASSPTKGDTLVHFGMTLVGFKLKIKYPS
jgi:hypothetical protein